MTYSRIKHLFAWTSLRNDVEQYVKACVVCQQAKPDRAKLPGLLQPYQAWPVDKPHKL